MIPSADEYFRKIHQTLALLDANNIRIFRSMKKHGPRNLQLIARDTGIPYPTVFARVSRLEKGGGIFHAWANPNHTKIGLSRAMVLVSPTPGKDLLAREALRIPGYWIRIIRSMGECNGYYSVHAVPTDNTREFEQYLEQFVPLGLASSVRVYWMDEQNSTISNFDYYDPEKGKWRFEWNDWLSTLSEDSTKPGKVVPPEKRSSATASFDKKDLIILKELNKDARIKLADFARMFKITLPAAKYRFDRIKEKGLISEFVIDLVPYSPLISDMYEVRLDFKTESQMLAKRTILNKIPFILHHSLIRGINSITTRVYLPRGEMNNLITLLSTLVRRGVLNNYTSLWLDPMTITAQTFSYEYYQDGKGWQYDNRDYNEQLQSILSTPEKALKDLVAFQPMSIATML